MNPTCRDCDAACCRTLILGIANQTPDDVALLAARGVRVGQVMVVPGRCKQLRDDGRCAVYAIRPKACREYPVDGPLCRHSREGLKKLREFLDLEKT